MTDIIRKPNPPKPSRKNTAVVIVTYHPDRDLIKKVTSLNKTFKNIIVIDNTGVENDVIQSIIDSETDVHVIINKENIGIAAAMNMGVGMALERGFPWTLTLDQDSWLQEDFIDEISRTFMEIPENEPIALIGCNFRDPLGAIPKHKLRGKQGKTFIRTPVFISSGSLINNDAFRNCGQFIEEYFIDYVDNEYCLRARRHGYNIYVTRTPLMTHSVGNRSRHKILGITAYTSNHPAFRRYFMARNRLLTIKKFLSFDPSWCLHEIMTLVVEYIKIFALESSKKHKLSALTIGYWDAIRGNYKSPLMIMNKFR